MDHKIIANIFKAWQDVVEKKRLDPVGKADADIDNDGDVDSSDEYLHKRRKAIKKSMKGEAKVCPKCDGEGCEHCDGKGTHEAYESSCGLKASTNAYDRILDLYKTFDTKYASMIGDGSSVV